MIYGKRKSKNRNDLIVNFNNLNAALNAVAPYFRIDDIDLDSNEADKTLPYEEMDISSVDTERFIHGLSYEELVIILFRSLDTPISEIAEILNFDNVQKVYGIITNLENKARNRL